METSDLTVATMLRQKLIQEDQQFLQNTIIQEYFFPHSDNHQVPPTRTRLVNHKKSHRKTQNFCFHQNVTRSVLVLVLTCLVVLASGVSASNQSATHSSQGQPQKQKEISVDVGRNVTLPCENQSTKKLPKVKKKEINPPNVEWVIEGKANQSGALIQKDSGELVIKRADPSMSGRYQCIRGNSTASLVLRVMNVPAKVANMAVKPHASFVSVSWMLSTEETNSYPVSGFLCQYRMDNSHIDQPTEERTRWRNASTTVPILSNRRRVCDIYHLSPNTTYYFRVAAINKLGRGEYVAIMETTTVVREGDERDQGEEIPMEMDARYGRVLVISIVVSVVALLTLGGGIGLLTIKHRVKSAQPVRPLQESPGEEESLELVPHITLNPSFNIDMLEHIGPDHNDNSEYAFLVNNNSEVHPIR